MEKRPYATVDGIHSYLDSLEGMHRLVRDRHEAGRRFEHLPVFCVLGRYQLLADGGIGELTGVAARTGTARTVASLEEFERHGRQRFRGEWLMSYRTPPRLAHAGARCLECRRSWTLDDCHDAVLVPETHRVLVADAFVTEIRFGFTYHLDCHRRRVERDALWWAETFLDRVGLSDAEPETIIGRIPDDPTPWFRLATPAGPIRFGRRGVGFGLEWKETGRSLPDLFRGAQRQGHKIEHGAFYVLPPDEKYLLKHFTRLREALGF